MGERHAGVARASFESSGTRPVAAAKRRGCGGAHEVSTGRGQCPRRSQVGFTHVDDTMTMFAAIGRLVLRYVRDRIVVDARFRVRPDLHKAMIP